MRIPQEIVDKIYQASDLVDVISDYVNLKKKGRNFTSLSPFNSSDTAPSFIVSPEKNIWKCFSSGLGGNVVKFLMEFHGYGYREALEELANKYQIKIPEGSQSKKADYRSLLYDACEAAADYWHRTLLENEMALEYVMNVRKLSYSTIKKWKVGYCPGGTIEALGITHKVLIDAGIISYDNARNKHKDTFYGRIILPIKNQVGRVCGFTGRTLIEGHAKWINTRDTEIYNKSKTLYGLFENRKFLRGNAVVMVEGALDVLGPYNEDIKGFVAPCGTSVTTDHFRMMANKSNKVIIMTDGDMAGKKALVRSIMVALEAGVDPYIIEMPLNMDPDDYRKENPKRLKEVISEAEYWPEFFLRYYTNSQIAENKKKTLVTLTKCIAVAPPMIQVAAKDFISEKIGISREQLDNEIPTGPVIPVRSPYSDYKESSVYYKFLAMLVSFGGLEVEIEGDKLRIGEYVLELLNIRNDKDELQLPTFEDKNLQTIRNFLMGILTERQLLESDASSVYTEMCMDLEIKQAKPDMEGILAITKMVKIEEIEKFLRKIDGKLKTELDTLSEEEVKHYLNLKSKFQHAYQFEKRQLYGN